MVGYSTMSESEAAESIKILIHSCNCTRPFGSSIFEVTQFIARRFCSRRIELNFATSLMTSIIAAENLEPFLRAHDLN